MQTLECTKKGGFITFSTFFFCIFVSNVNEKEQTNKYK